MLCCVKKILNKETHVFNSKHLFSIYYWLFVVVFLFNFRFSTIVALENWLASKGCLQKPQCGNSRAEITLPNLCQLFLMIRVPAGWGTLIVRLRTGLILYFPNINIMQQFLFPQGAINNHFSFKQLRHNTAIRQCCYNS